MIWTHLSTIASAFRGIPENAKVLGIIGILCSSNPKICAVCGTWRAALGRQLERKIQKDAAAFLKDVFTAKLLPGNFLKRGRHSFGQGSCGQAMGKQLWKNHLVKKWGNWRLRCLRCICIVHICVCVCVYIYTHIYVYIYINIFIFI